MRESMYRKFGGMVWPAPGNRLDALEWKLRNGHKEGITTADLMAAGAVLEAYRQMIADPVRKRQMVVRELRQGPNVYVPPGGVEDV